MSLLLYRRTDRVRLDKVVSAPRPRQGSVQTTSAVSLAPGKIGSLHIHPDNEPQVFLFGEGP